MDGIPVTGIVDSETIRKKLNLVLNAPVKVVTPTPPQYDSLGDYIKKETDKGDPNKWPFPKGDPFGPRLDGYSLIARC